MISKENRYNNRLVELRNSGGRQVSQQMTALIKQGKLTSTGTTTAATGAAATLNRSIPSRSTSNSTSHPRAITTSRSTIVTRAAATLTNTNISTVNNTLKANCKQLNSKIVNIRKHSARLTKAYDECDAIELAGRDKEENNLLLSSSTTTTTPPQSPQAAVNCFNNITINKQTTQQNQLGSVGSLATRVQLADCSLTVSDQVPTPTSTPIPPITLLVESRLMSDELKKVGECKRKKLNETSFQPEGNQNRDEEDVKDKEIIDTESSIQNEIEKEKTIEENLKNKEISNDIESISTPVSIDVSASSQCNETIKTTNNNEKNETTIEEYQSKFLANQEKLKESFKSTSMKLRELQSRFFKSNLEKQLSNVLALKNDANLQKFDDQSKKTLSNSDECANSNIFNSKIDDNAIELLNSILKSYLPLNSNERPSKTSVSEDPLKPLTAKILDSVGYEFLKEKESEETPLLFNIVLGENEKLNLVKYGDEQCEKSIKDLLKDRSNWRWNTDRIRFGSEWQRVQAKMKQLKQKDKQCDEYLNRCIRLEKRNGQLYAKIEKEDNYKESSIIEKTKIEEISSKLKESIVSITKNDLTNNKNKKNDINNQVKSPGELDTQNQSNKKANVNTIVDSETTSRCSILNRKSLRSRLFNLNKSDFIKLNDTYFNLNKANITSDKQIKCQTLIKKNIRDEDEFSSTLKHFYNTVRYYDLSMFKNSCSCNNNVNSLLAKSEQNSFSQLRRSARLRKVPKKLDSHVLSETKSCIFCHLLRREHYQKDAVVRQSQRRQSDHSEQSEADMDSSAASFRGISTLDVVRIDHNYSKYPYINSNRGSVHSEASRAKRAKLNAMSEKSSPKEISDQYQLPSLIVDKILDERVEKLFATHHSTKDEAPVDRDTRRLFKSDLLRTDDSSISLDSEEFKFIEVGIELDPKDKDNLPNLSYEEYVI
jgi:hypothetical protein